MPAPSGATWAHPKKQMRGCNWPDFSELEPVYCFDDQRRLDQLRSQWSDRHISGGRVAA
jgi:hypothetical protein